MEHLEQRGAQVWLPYLLNEGRGPGRYGIMAPPVAILGTAPSLASGLGGMKAVLGAVQRCQFLLCPEADWDPSPSFPRKTSLLSVLQTASRRSAARGHSWLWGSEPQERLRPGRSHTVAGAEATQPRRPEQTGQIPRVGWLGQGCARLGGSGLPTTPRSDCFPDVSRLRCGLNRSC